MDDFGDVDEMLAAEIDEVHAVHKAANGFSFLLMKAEAPQEPADLRKAMARRLAADPALLADLRKSVQKAQRAVEDELAERRKAKQDQVMRDFRSTVYKTVQSAVNRHPTPWVTTDMTPRRRS